MRISSFSLKEPEIFPDHDESGAAIYRVPTLSAYAIENAELWTYGDADGVAPTHFLMDSGFSIEGDKVIWKQYRTPYLGPHIPITLVIYYHGVRDYKLLFPLIKESDAKNALAMYYQEADSAFENGCWLSFVVMCGAIFEGLLRTRLGKSRPGFLKLIEESEAKGILSASQAETCEQIRQFRNSIHSSEFSVTRSLRANAMDARVVLDYIVRELGSPNAWGN